jgi:putative spermidine/putrescine transport system permease protein
LEKWDGKDLPEEPVYAALYEDLSYLKKTKTYGKIIARLNYEKGGFSSLIKKTVRKINKFEEGNYKEQFIAVHKKWGQIEYMGALKSASPNWTYAKYLKGVDLKFDQKGNIIQQPEDRRIHKILWMRTINVAFWVTLFCFVLAYPIAHLLATLPMKYSNLLMICVLLPFWTSLLVRTSSWMVLLQQQGPINDLIVLLGIAENDNRPELMYNVIGTFVAMTQILLPFMVLPLYSVMKTISPSLMRAGKSLGGTPLISFYKIYFPLTVPGIGAGSLLVFILSIGYYITPALVGGASGSLISNTIAYHMKSSLDWAFASALGAMLLVGVLTIYWIYNKLVGIDNIKLG